MPIPRWHLRGTLIIQFVSGFRLCGIPGRRWVKGKVGLKVGQKQLSSAGHATGPSPRGSLAPGARQDKSRHKPTLKVNQSVLHCDAVCPPPHAHQQDTNPP